MSFEKALSKLALLVFSSFLFLLVGSREMIFSDDFEYLRIYTDVISDFESASAKYGFVYKIYLTLLDGSGLGSVQLAFGGVLLTLGLIILFHNNNKNNLTLYFLLVSSMPIIWFVQMRQGLALVFVVGLILVANKKIKFLYSILAVSSHISVFPFILWFYLIDEWRIKLISSNFMQFVFAVLFIYSSYFALTNRDLIVQLTGLPLDILVSNEALLEGNTGVGTVAIFSILLLELYYLRGGNRVLFSIAINGFSILLLSYFLPLVQRLISPFLAYLIIHVSVLTGRTKLYIGFNIILFISFSSYKLIPYFNL